MRIIADGSAADARTIAKGIAPPRASVRLSEPARHVLERSTEDDALRDLFFWHHRSLPEDAVIRHAR
jgi:hypothetical protein